MILLDTSFIIAYYSVRDKNHARAKELMGDLANGSHGSLAITDYVFDETVTGFLKTGGITGASKLGATLLGSLKLFNTTPEEFDTAWSLFKSQHRTTLSFTDCTIIVLMEANAITKLVSFDEDFEGFKDITVMN